DRDRGSLVVVRRADRRVRVDVVVVAHLLAAELAGLGDAGAAGVLPVEGCRLVGVLAVAQRRLLRPGRADPLGEWGARLVRRHGAADPARDGDVVGGGVAERLSGERLALLERRAAGAERRD